MSNSRVPIKRPERWDKPLDPAMTLEEVERLLAIDVFQGMDRRTFPPSAPLEGILRNDCRVVPIVPGQIIVRQGDYGHSAFVVLRGRVGLVLSPLRPETVGRQPRRQRGVWQALSQLWRNSRVAEVRRSARPAAGLRHGSRPSPALMLQDWPQVIEADGSSELGPGEIFGGLAALYRTPRAATVVGIEDGELLEIRWQGLRDMLKRDAPLRQRLDALYREKGLRPFLKSVRWLAHVPDDQIDRLAAATELATFGTLEWSGTLRAQAGSDVAERILREPAIVEEGDYVNAWLLVRNGFARVSQRFGDGHRSIAYIGKGHEFGLREIVHNARTGGQRGYLLSLRALGYVDVLSIPTAAVEELVLPRLPAALCPAPLSGVEGSGAGPGARPRERRLAARSDPLAVDLLEFIVENRLLNGTRAMVIDLDRCTRCDDCVRACAAAHDNNPRFVRQGPIHDRWMFAHACMHCADPVCMIGCPTGAIGRDVESGLAVINDQTCIGCGTCAASCPYQNIQMVPIRDGSGRPQVDAHSQLPILQATKCDYCIDQRGGPACQRACPHGALVRIDLTTPEPMARWVDSRGGAAR